MLKKKYIVYIGIEEPETEEQIAVELSGLEHAICVANERIASLKQSLSIAELQKKEMKE